MSITPLLAELLEQPLRDAEGAAEVADVLAEHEDALVLAHRVGDGRPDRLEVGDLAHRPVRARPYATAPRAVTDR